MRLLFVQQYFYPDNSAVAQLLTELTVELSQRFGHEVHVLCSANATAEHRASRRHRGVWIHRVPMPPLGRRTIIRRIAVLAVYYANCFLWSALAPGFDAVVVMTTPPLIGFVAAIGMSFRARPFVYYIEDLYPEILLDSGIIRKPWLIKKLGVLNRITLRRADAVISISRDITRKLYLNYGYPRNRVKEVPNWSTSVKYEAPIPGNLSIVYSGNLGLAHDFSLVPALLCELSGCDDIHYEIGGGGVRLAEMRRLFRSSGEKRVTFRRHVELARLSEALSRAHFFLLSQAETMVGDLLPSKLYGYLAAGRPVVFLGTKSSEIGRMIVDSDLGFVLETERDIVGLKDKLEGTLDHWDGYRDWCERISRFYLERFSLERSAAKINRIIEGVAVR